MSDPSPPVAMISFAYGATYLGAATAFALRAGLQRGGRMLSAFEALICAFMPIMALIVFITTSLFQPFGLDLPSSVHHSFNKWPDVLHSTPQLHIAMHDAHWAVLAYALICFVRMVKAFVQTRDLTTRMNSLPRQALFRDDATVVVLNTTRPLSFTLGILHPRVYVSTALLEELTPQERKAMLAHEAAHIRRRDGLWNMVLSVAYQLLPVPGGAALCRDWKRAAERACDAAAAKHIGNPCDVASALVVAARLVTLQSAPGVSHFANGDDIEGRVEELLAGDTAPQQKSSLLAIALAASTIMFVAGEVWLRHLVELFVYH